mmetsp:Transcript_16321/g.35461  ORF Transcript_16321/g.35461 Transcript_16321/m.35461 type:complete len:88 (+) Transcript_16321:398-661(+)
MLFLLRRRRLLLSHQNRSGRWRRRRRKLCVISCHVMSCDDVSLHDNVICIDKQEKIAVGEARNVVKRKARIQYNTMQCNPAMLQIHA